MPQVIDAANALRELRQCQEDHRATIERLRWARARVRGWACITTKNIAIMEEIDEFLAKHPAKGELQ